MVNYYTTLALVEARYATDFNDASGDINFPWSPTDTQIYDVETPTNPSLVTAASTLINQYAGTTFANQSSTPYNIEEACNQTVMRLIEERWIKHQLMGGSSVSDEYGAISVFAGTFEILTAEIRLLIDESKEWAFTSNTN